MLRADLRPVARHRQHQPGIPQVFHQTARLRDRRQGEAFCQSLEQKRLAWMRDEMEGLRKWVLPDLRGYDSLFAAVTEQDVPLTWS